MITLHQARKICVLSCVLLIAACSNGRGSVDDAPPTAPAQAGFTLGGGVSGLVGSGLVLQNNGGNDLTVATNGAIVFSGTLNTGAAYNVTVLTQPSNPTQNCTVGNGTGTVGNSNVTNITVTCATTGPTGSFAVGGTVTGLAGSGLVLRNNGADDLTVAANGEFSFATAIASGSPYNVTVATQPANPAQTCTVVNGSGTMAGSDVTGVSVTCATAAFTVGGSVSGLTGRGLVLHNNGGADSVTLNADGTFVFQTPIAQGAAYSVTVATHPTNPAQSCTVSNGSGVMAGANVTNVAVSCSTNLFTIGGTVNGLAGSGLRLRLNNSIVLDVNVGGTFAFGQGLPSGTNYVVVVDRQPSNPTQTCNVGNSTGVVTGNVSNIVVTCTTGRFRVGGEVRTLSGSGLVLQLNGADDLSIASNGVFTFPTQLLSGTTYRVTVRTQPSNPSQTCTVSPGEGTVGAGDVRNVMISCATNTFRITGTVSGLLGRHLRLLNNGGDSIEIQSDGAFAFSQRISSGATYNVTVGQQPDTPTQACTVTNPSGTVTTADITNISVSCTTSSFMIRGTVRNLAGSGLVLRNNGGDDLTISNGSGGSFVFPTPLASGSPYNVTVAVQPTGPAQLCTVSAGSGTVGGADVTDVVVDCVTTEFTLGGTVSGLFGLGLSLQNNGADTLSIAANGAFTFPSSVQTGMPYNVTVSSHPVLPPQTCTVANGAGTVGSAPITDVTVTCQ